MPTFNISTRRFTLPSPKFGRGKFASSFPRGGGSPSLTPASVAAVNLFFPSNGSFFTDEAGTVAAVNNDPIGRWATGKVGTPYASNSTGSQRPTKTSTGLQTVDGTTVLNLSSSVAYTGDFTLWISGTLATTSSKWWPVCGSPGSQAAILIGYSAAFYFRPDAAGVNQITVAHTTLGFAAGTCLVRVRRVSDAVYVMATGMPTEYSLGTSTGTFTASYLMQWVGQDVTTNTINRTRSVVGKTGGAVDADAATIQSWFLTTDGVSL